MYENYKIYGPYQGRDNRLRIFIRNSSGDQHTISYPKYLMECHIGRHLSKDEQIDHIDGNPLNNNINNLQILKLGEHQKLDALRNKDITVNCTYCGKEFIIKGSTINDRNRKDKGSSGYFCSRSCSGKYGKEIQLKQRLKTLQPVVIPDKYMVKSAQKEIFDVEAG